MFRSFPSAAVSRAIAQYFQPAKGLPAITRLKLHQNNNFKPVETRVEKKKEIQKYDKLVSQIKEILSCTDNEAEVFIQQNKMLWRTSVAKMSKNIEYLLDRKVSAATISENPWILGTPYSESSLKAVLT